MDSSLYIVISILFGIIFVSRHSVRFSHFIGNKKPIAVLATFVLLSFYTHFLQTALLVLAPSTIVTITPIGCHENSVWFLNGSVDYFEGKHNIPLFILAIFILLFVVIYKIIIFSWQWVVRLPKVWILKWTNIRSSFIQTYQVPFCDQRPITSRMSLPMCSYFHLNCKRSSQCSITINHVSFGLPSTFVADLCQKFSYQWIYILETVLIINLFDFTIAMYTFDGISKRRIFAYILTTFVLLLFMIVIAYTYGQL